MGGTPLAAIITTNALNMCIYTLCLHRRIRAVLPIKMAACNKAGKVAHSIVHALHLASECTVAVAVVCIEAAVRVVALSVTCAIAHHSGEAAVSAVIAVSAIKFTLYRAARGVAVAVPDHGQPAVGMAVVVAVALIEFAELVPARGVAAAVGKHRGEATR